MTDTLIGVGDRHRSPGLDVSERPGRYVGCFENRYGEQLVFVHDASEPTASLYLGDVDWQRRQVSDAGGLPAVEDLILNGEERAFVCACWLATAPARPPALSSAAGRG